MPEDRNILELKQRVVNVEKTLESIPAIDKRVSSIEKSLEPVKGIAQKVDSIEQSLAALPAIEKRVKVIEDLGTRIGQVTISIDAVSKKMESIDKSLSIIPEFEKRVKTLEEQMKAKPVPETETERIHRDNFELKRLLSVEQLKVQNLSADYTKLQEKHDNLAGQLEFLTKNMQTIKFDTLTTQFRDAIDSVNRQVATTNGGQSYFIDNLDIELKTGLQYGNELKLMQAVPDRSSPENLSTIKFSLKPKTELKFTD
jgi:chromosome segregation ATPase